MAVRALKAMVPWWARIPAKIALARLPVPFAVWRRLRLFQLGSMHDGGYASLVLGRLLGDLLAENGLAGRTLLELGPGDGVATGLFASCHGAARTWLVDAGDFATRDVRVYRAMLANWRARGLDVAHLEGARTFEELCAAGRTTYLTGGLASLRSLSSASVDVQVSNAVLEHVRLAELDATLRELARVLRPDGVGRHAVDLRDHLGGALNHLRFDERRWESPLFAGSGFYTNRVRYGAMLARFAAAGFDARVTRTWSWPEPATPRERLRPEFQASSDDDLRTWGFDVELRVAPSVEAAAPSAAPAPARAAVLQGRR